MNWLPLNSNTIPYWLFPWNTPTWHGFNAAIFHKELLALDSVRQIFPWKAFVAEQLLNHQWPLWNPYNFSGQPLLANFQSTTFYPFSLLFLIFPEITAWTIFNFLQPILAFLMMYFYLAVKKMPISVRLFGSLCLIFMSFFVTHYFFALNIHVFMWLPALLAISDLLLAKKIRPLIFVFLQSVLCSLAILAGYPQFAFFVLLIDFLYFWAQNGIKRIPLFFAGAALAIGLCAAQLFPTAEIYKFSLREGAEAQKVTQASIVNWNHVVTVLNPDFFGTPAHNDYFGGQDYAGTNFYFGIIALPFALYGLLQFKKNRDVRFWSAVALLGLVMALKTPIAQIPIIFKIPLLSGSSVWNNLFLFQFAAVMLAVYGFNHLLKNPEKQRVFLIVGILLLPIFAMAFWFGKESNSTIKSTTLTMGSLILLLFLTTVLTRYRKIIVPLLALISGTYFAIKFLPFGQTEYFYPQHPLITYISQNSHYYRDWGYGSSRLPTNLGIYYKFFQPEGYDSLSPGWYGELISSAQTGKIPPAPNRADVFITETDTKFRQKLLDLVGVRYFVDKSEDPLGDRGPNLSKYPADRFKLIIQWGILSVYENLNVVARPTMASSYIVRSQKEVLSSFYDPAFDPHTTVILEENPHVDNLTTGTASITKYDPNQVTISAHSDGSSILFLSDTFFPGWKAFVNGKETKIYKADYAFRAVVIPKGQNTVIFSYEPQSFAIGLKVSILSIIIAICLWPVAFLQKKLLRQS